MRTDHLGHPHFSRLVLDVSHAPRRHAGDWGLQWGHVSSSDLVTWARHAPALAPTPGHFDSLACFSGTAVPLPGRDGVLIVYTGVRPRRKVTLTGLSCAHFPGTALPCECLELPPSPEEAPSPRRFSLNFASPKRTSFDRQMSLDGSRLSLGLRPSFDRRPLAPTPQPPARGDDRPIGCAAELYAATLATWFEEEVASASGSSTPLSLDGTEENEALPPPSGAPPLPKEGWGEDGACLLQRGVGAADACAYPDVSAPRGSVAGRRLSCDWLEGLDKQPFVEAVCAAVSRVGDAALSGFDKRSAPLIASPPPSLAPSLLGWRDPFVFLDDVNGAAVYRMIVGTGVRGVGGATLVYTASLNEARADVASPAAWSYTGFLCAAAAGTSEEVGSMWECPTLARLGKGQTLFCVSPDRPTNRVLYWIGDYSHGVFNLASASGPHALDCGDVLYAVGLFQHGCPGDDARRLLMGWLQERDCARAAAFRASGGRAARRSADGRALAVPCGRTTIGGVSFSSVEEAAQALEAAAAAGYAVRSIFMIYAVFLFISRASYITRAACPSRAT